MQYRIVLVLTAMAAGRAMTIPFIGSAGDGGPGDPPAEWLMPLIGDAFVGVAALAVLFLLIKRPTPGTWAIAIAWNAVAAFDAIAAFVVNQTSPWPEFFMLEIFGTSMFFAATALHVAAIWLLTLPAVREQSGVS